MMSVDLNRALVVAALMLALAALIVACDPGSDEPEPNDPTPWAEAWTQADDFGWMLSVHGTDGGPLYAVGGEPEAGRVAIDDGSGWRAMELPVEVPLLNWVYALDDDDVWIVGNGGTVIHYDGASWTLEQTPTDEDLWGVWGASPDDLWAVGGRGREEGQQTVLRKQNGGPWERVELPDLERPGVFAFFKVWGSGPDDVYIVGRRGGMLHWDGQALTELGVGTSEDLISVWGTDADHVAVVGGRNNGVLATWDGAAWTLYELAPTPGINGVFMRDPSTVHIVGVRGTTATVDFDTGALTRQTVETELDLHAVWANGDGRAIGVGGSFVFPTAPFRGLLVERQLGGDE